MQILGDRLQDAIVRLVIAQKIAALARGYSGVRYEVIEALVRLMNANVMPCIPAQGSVGASGDLAPLAHLAALMIGEGSARIDGRVVDAGDALAAVGLMPLELALLTSSELFLASVPKSSGLAAA